MGKVHMLPPFQINVLMRTLVRPKNWGMELHNVPEEWKLSRGAGVRVGVIDTGRPIHRDLEEQIEESANFTDSPLEDQVQGHSTHVCGVIAARDTPDGVIGMAPRARLFVAKALGDDGGGSDEWLSRAIYWCMERQVHVINMSLGVAGVRSPWDFPNTRLAVARAHKQGIVLVCAAGNDGQGALDFPASLPEPIAVAAVNNARQRAAFSNYGEGLDLAAAGVGVMSCFKNNTYASLSGTSMAAPQVTGILALLLSEHLARREAGLAAETPIDSPADALEHLRKICVDLGPAGYDTDFGYGVPVFGHLGTDAEGRPLALAPPRPWWRRWLPW